MVRGKRAADDASFVVPGTPNAKRVRARPKKGLAVPEVAGEGDGEGEPAEPVEPATPAAPTTPRRGARKRYAPLLAAAAESIGTSARGTRGKSRPPLAPTATAKNGRARKAPSSSPSAFETAHEPVSPSVVAHDGPTAANTIPDKDDGTGILGHEPEPKYAATLAMIQALGNRNSPRAAKTMGMQKTKSIISVKERTGLKAPRAAVTKAAKVDRTRRRAGGGRKQPLGGAALASKERRLAREAKEAQAYAATITQEAAMNGGKVMPTSQLGRGKRNAANAIPQPPSNLGPTPDGAALTPPPSLPGHQSVQAVDQSQALANPSTPISNPQTFPQAQAASKSMSGSKRHSRAAAPKAVNRAPRVEEAQEESDDSGEEEEGDPDLTRRTKAWADNVVPQPPPPAPEISSPRPSRRPPPPEVVIPPLSGVRSRNMVNDAGNINSSTLPPPSPPSASVDNAPQPADKSSAPETASEPTDKRASPPPPQVQAPLPGVSQAPPPALSSTPLGPPPFSQTAFDDRGGSRPARSGGPHEGAPPAGHTPASTHHQALVQQPMDPPMDPSTPSIAGSLLGLPSLPTSQPTTTLQPIIYNFPNVTCFPINPPQSHPPDQAGLSRPPWTNASWQRQGQWHSNSDNDSPSRNAMGYYPRPDGHSHSHYHGGHYENGHRDGNDLFDDSYGPPPRRYSNQPPRAQRSQRHSAPMAPPPPDWRRKGAMPDVMVNSVASSEHGRRDSRSRRDSDSPPYVSPDETAAGQRNDEFKAIVNGNGGTNDSGSSERSAGDDEEPISVDDPVPAVVQLGDLVKGYSFDPLVARGLQAQHDDIRTKYEAGLRTSAETFTKTTTELENAMEKAIEESVRKIRQRFVPRIEAAKEERATTDALLKATYVKDTRKHNAAVHVRADQIILDEKKKRAAMAIEEQHRATVGEIVRYLNNEVHWGVDIKSFEDLIRDPFLKDKQVLLWKYRTLLEAENPHFAELEKGEAERQLFEEERDQSGCMHRSVSEVMADEDEEQEAAAALAQVEQAKKTKNAKKGKRRR